MFISLALKQCVECSRDVVYAEFFCIIIRTHILDRGLSVRRVIEVFLLVSFVFSTNALASDAKSMAELNIEVLDSFCVQNSDDYYNIVQMAPLFEGMELTEEMKNADPNLRKSGGTGYFIKYEDNVYILGFSKTGGCSVGSMDIDHANLSNLVVKRYSATLIDSEPTGYQTHELYRVGLKGSNNGSFISIMYPFDASGYKEGTISFITKAAAMKAKQH